MLPLHHANTQLPPGFDPGMPDAESNVITNFTTEAVPRDVFSREAVRKGRVVWRLNRGLADVEDCAEGGAVPQLAVRAWAGWHRVPQLPQDGASFQIVRHIISHTIH